MSVLDGARRVLGKADEPPEPAPLKPIEVPPDVRKRLERGRAWMKRDAHKRRLCSLFLKGEAYFYLDNKGALNQQFTAPGVNAGKPRHRVRNKYNFIRPMVDAKVSSSTTRVPGYEVNPSSTDPEDTEASQLAGKLLRQGYKRWYLREARVKAVTTAIGEGGSAFALPYFDPMVGPFRMVPGDPEDGSPDRLVGEGEIKVLVGNGNEVFWEPGTEFYHSRWHAWETARPIAEVQQMHGFIGGVLQPDASTKDIPIDRPDEDMVMVTLYFERPSPRYRDGRMLTLAGGRMIVPPMHYPMVQPESRGEPARVLDEPCIHRLSYRLDPDNERDLGLTWELIDFQRTLNDTYNKIIEIKNRGLRLQMLAPKGSLDQAPSDEPGEIIYYNPVGGYKPEWERSPDPGLIGQLMQILDRALQDMRYVAADTDVDVAPNVAAGAVQQVIQQAANRWSSFLEDLASWDSAIARHCLLLAQHHYNEDRILKVRGRFGWEPVQSFRGASIMGQVDVTVNPATIETRSRQAMLSQLGWIQANFPGYMRPEVAIEIAMNGASPESLIESFEFDKARANMVIQKILDGSIWDMPKRPQIDPMTGAPMLTAPEPLIDPATGQPVVNPETGVVATGEPKLAEIPGWMPREFDNVEVQKWVFETWLKTPDAANLEPEMHEVAMEVYRGFQSLEAQQQAQALAAQTAQAEELGMGNAAKPQSQDGKPMPSTPSPAGQEG
ncbi:MAG TPA: hypothetical protein VE645_18895 [Pseudonocardiaceae bacterium]|nr:hypothetical protein [Pseudonocardiaceae bacterium]